MGYSLAKRLKGHEAELAKIINEDGVLPAQDYCEEMLREKTSLEAFMNFARRITGNENPKLLADYHRYSVEDLADDFVAKAFKRIFTLEEVTRIINDRDTKISITSAILRYIHRQHAELTRLRLENEILRDNRTKAANNTKRELSQLVDSIKENQPTSLINQLELELSLSPNQVPSKQI